MNSAPVNNLANGSPLLGENVSDLLVNAFGIGILAGGGFSSGSFPQEFEGEISFQDFLDSERALQQSERAANHEVPLIQHLPASFQGNQELPADEPLVPQVALKAQVVSEDENYPAQITAEANIPYDLSASKLAELQSANSEAINAANNVAPLAAVALAAEAAKQDTTPDPSLDTPQAPQDASTRFGISSSNELSIAQAAGAQSGQAEPKSPNASRESAPTFSEFISAKSTSAESLTEAVAPATGEPSNLAETGVPSKPESNDSDESYSPQTADFSAGNNATDSSPLGSFQPSDTTQLQSNERFATQPHSEIEVTKVVTDNLVQQVQLTEEGESKQLRLQLHPAELGQVTLQVDWENDSLKVKLLASEMAANEILNQNRAELVTALAEEGIDFDSLEISYERDNSDASQEQPDDETDAHPISPDLFAPPSSNQAGTMRHSSTAKVDITI